LFGRFISLFGRFISLFGRFISLFGRFISLFDRLGNSLSNRQYINGLPAQNAP